MHRLKKQIDYAKFTENSIVTLDIDYAERLLLELTEQYESPTLEQVKKEWEELGYEWHEINLYIRLIQNKIEWQGYTKEIYIDKGTKTYCCFNEETGDGYLYIEPLEHQLLTKTFKALGWI